MRWTAAKSSQPASSDRHRCLVRTPLMSNVAVEISFAAARDTVARATMRQASGSGHGMRTDQSSAPASPSSSANAAATPAAAAASRRSRARSAESRLIVVPLSPSQTCSDSERAPATLTSTRPMRLAARSVRYAACGNMPVVIQAVAIEASSAAAGGRASSTDVACSAASASDMSTVRRSRRAAPPGSCTAGGMNTTTGSRCSPPPPPPPPPPSKSPAPCPASGSPPSVRT
mmetsp:Transcript_1999/g.6411  ORF Transcript_1999/g.6411 Transcript_1999/m.6411 type:complete len:231 (-) Transcript_1999:424-1116(-)